MASSRVLEDQPFTLEKRQDVCAPRKEQTPQNRIILEKPTVLQRVKEISQCYKTRRFVTLSTRARHLPLSWARSIQSTPPIPFLEDPFYYYTPMYTYVFQVISFLQVSPPTPYMHFLSPPHILHVSPISLFFISSPKYRIQFMKLFVKRKKP